MKIELVITILIWIDFWEIYLMTIIYILKIKNYGMESMREKIIESSLQPHQAITSMLYDDKLLKVLENLHLFSNLNILLRILILT